MELAQGFVARLLWNWGTTLTQSVISITMLPVVTAILGPAEIGTFALVMATSGLIAAASGTGSSYLLSAHYPTLPSSERQRLVSTLVALSAAIATLGGLAMVSLWPFVTGMWPPVADIPLSSVELAMSAAIAGVPWTIATDTLMLRGQARAYAIVGTLQSVLGATVTVFCLYVFDLGLPALFISALATSALGGLAGLILLWSDLSLRVDRRWLGELCKVGPIMGGAHFLETVQTVIERTIVASAVGMTALGIYTHSQQYRNMVQVGVKGLRRTVWPVSLNEAQPRRGSFPLTNRAWRVMTLAITVTGVLAAFLGRDFVGFLTHGKFAEAGPYVALWMVYVLVQNSGQPQLAILFAEGRGTVLGWIGQGTRAIGIVLLLLLVPTFGLAGAFAALLIQQSALRLAVHVHAWRAGPTPFQDGWLLEGCVAIAIALLVDHELGPSLTIRIAFAAGFLLLIAMAGRAVLRDALTFVRARACLSLRSLARPDAYIRSKN